MEQILSLEKGLLKNIISNLLEEVIILNNQKVQEVGRFRAISFDGRSYEFIVYDEADEVYYTSGEQLHQSAYDTEYNFSTDRVFINDFV